MRKSLKHLTYALLIFVLLLAVPLTFAQEAAPTAAETPAAAPGISTLVFLLGAGAIIVVGGASLARDRYNADKNEGS
jgi:hypothetical protein